MDDALAIVIYDARFKNEKHPVKWDNLPESAKDVWRDSAQAAMDFLIH